MRLSPGCTCRNCSTPLGRTPSVIIAFPAGEASKSVSQISRIHDGLAEARIGRRDLILTFGGGVAGDLGGFAAATWLRGVRFIQVPTTLAAAVDASIGGKTGINHASGKNLIGAFHQPSAVVVDTELLETLAARDFVAGLAESVKHAAIREGPFLDWHVQQAESIRTREPSVVEELIARNCALKAGVVECDERESDLRMILNHGHTIGHAFEHLLEYELRHGECVALGMLAENEIACGRGLLSGSEAQRIARLLAGFGLPIRLPRKLGPADVAEVCQSDKKARGRSRDFCAAGGYRTHAARGRCQ